MEKGLLIQSPNPIVAWRQELCHKNAGQGSFKEERYIEGGAINYLSSPTSYVHDVGYIAFSGNVWE
jgi:hypothetical protein